MSVWVEKHQRPRRRARWIRPVCFALVLMLLPLPWARSSCGGSTQTGVHVMFQQHEMALLTVGALAISLAAVWVAPMLILWLRLLLDLVSALGLVALSALVVLGISFLSEPYPAGGAALGAFLVADVEALWRTGVDVRDLFRAWWARCAAARTGSPREGADSRPSP